MTAEVEEIVKSLLRIAPPHKTFAPPVFLFWFFLCKMVLKPVK